MVTGDGFPAKCTRMNAEGPLPDCVQHSDGTWEAVYRSAGPGGGAFVALFLLALVIGVAGTIWKVSTARRMAREAGMDTGDAQGLVTEAEHAAARQRILDEL